MFSYWEQKNFLKYDLIVIGSGFVGLSTAIHFKKKHPKSSVVVLERGIFPSGASSKNAGFACFGSLTEILDDFRHMSEDEVLGLVNKRYMGLKEIKKKFGKKELGYKDSKGYELLEESQLSALSELARVNKMLKGLFKEDVFSEVKGFKKYGFSDSIKMVIQNKFEGELDPARYLKSLWDLAGKLGIRLLNGVNVSELNKDTGQVLAKNSWDGKSFEFHGRQLAICTNAFTNQLLPQEDLNPGRGLVMVSEPLDFKISWKGSFHMDKGYVYFRKIDGRLLLGGARNVDFENEETTDFMINPKIESHLDRLANEVIFPGREIKWDTVWTGIMAFGKKKTPIIQQVGNRAVIAVRLGGMGVAIGWQVGKDLASLISEK
ncbi:FAD-binding oxidoreductase [Algoriphagus sp. SE2]|uniref:NAD(P)/FAD-dependent oxidoreductase n=1 Tax=Algoriphagus sp. SE2 TaxID=3141536 RepID=UPI0031CD4FAC